MSARSSSGADTAAWMAIARKDARQAATAIVQIIVIIALVAVTLVVLDATGIAAAFVRELALLLVVPVSAAALGGGLVAGERAEGTLGFLEARAISRRALLGAKLVAGAAGVAVTWGLAILLIAAMPGAVDAKWLEIADVPAVHATAWSLTLSLVVFAFAFACSLLLPDAVTATLGGLLLGGAWMAAGVGGIAWLAGSWDVALRLGPKLEVALLAAPAVLVATLALGSRTDASTAVPRRALALASCGVALLAWLPVVVAPADLAHARAARAGRATVEPTRVLPHPSGSGVAFVVTTREHGTLRQQAALAFFGRDATHVDVRVLPPGTSPVGWVDRTSDLLVEWPAGGRRAVGPDGRDAGTGGALSSQSDPASFVVRDGRLVLDRDGAARPIYPPHGAGGTP